MPTTIEEQIAERRQRIKEAAEASLHNLRRQADNRFARRRPTQGKRNTPKTSDYSPRPGAIVNFNGAA